MTILICFVFVYYIYIIIYKGVVNTIQNKNYNRIGVSQKVYQSNINICCN